MEEEKSSKASASPFDQRRIYPAARLYLYAQYIARQVHVSVTAHVRDALEDVRNEQAPRPVCDILSCSRDGGGACFSAVLCMMDETARQMRVAIAAGQPLSVSMRCCRIRQAGRQAWRELEGPYGLGSQRRVSRIATREPCMHV